MADTDLIVVGGGISGMSMANACAAVGMHVLVLDQGDAPGGCLMSRQGPDGYWYEMGAHTCYNSYNELLGLVEGLPGGFNALLPRVKVPTRLVVDGQVRSLMQEIRMGEFLLHAPRMFFQRKAGKTVRQFWGAVTGPGNWERVFAPVFAAVPSQPADDFPASMLFKARKRRKDAPRSFTLAGGLQSLALGLAKRQNVRVQSNADVQALWNGTDGEYVVSLADGQELSATHVALAVPPDAAARLLTDVAPEASAAAAKVATCKVDTIGVAVRREEVRLPLAAFFIPLEDAFRSCVTRDTVPDARYRGFTFHLRPDVDEATALQRIQDFLGVADERWLDMARHQVVLPSPRLGHEALVAAVDQALAGTTLAVTGNWFGGLALEDCVQRSTVEAKRLAGMATGASPNDA